MCVQEGPKYQLVTFLRTIGMRICTFHDFCSFQNPTHNIKFNRCAYA